MGGGGDSTHSRTLRDQPGVLRRPRRARLDALSALFGIGIGAIRRSGFSPEADVNEQMLMMSIESPGGRRRPPGLKEVAACLRPVARLVFRRIRRGRGSDCRAIRAGVPASAN